MYVFRISQHFRNGSKRQVVPVTTPSHAETEDKSSPVSFPLQQNKYFLEGSKRYGQENVEILQFLFCVKTEAINHAELFCSCLKKMQLVLECTSNLNFYGEKSIQIVQNSTYTPPQFRLYRTPNWKVWRNLWMQCCLSSIVIKILIFEFTFIKFFQPEILNICFSFTKISCFHRIYTANIKIVQW